MTPIQAIQDGIRAKKKITKAREALLIARRDLQNAPHHWRYGSCFQHCADSVARLDVALAAIDGEHDEE